MKKQYIDPQTEIVHLQPEGGLLLLVSTLENGEVGAPALFADDDDSMDEGLLY